MKTRRVGMFTFGAFLLIAGIALFTANILNIEYLLPLLKYWPLILVSIGVETLIAYYSNPEKIKYDVWSFILISFLLLMLIGAATIDYTIKNPNVLQKIDMKI